MIDRNLLERADRALAKAKSQLDRARILQAEIRTDLEGNTDPNADDLREAMRNLEDLIPAWESEIVHLQSVVGHSRLN